MFRRRRTQLFTIGNRVLIATGIRALILVIYSSVWDEAIPIGFEIPRHNTYSNTYSLVIEGEG